jgi:Flp pilus assembly protein CpaB
VNPYRPHLILVLQGEISVNRSNRLVIFVGVLLAILAFVGIVILLNQQNPTTNPETTKVTVVIAKADIKIGDPVTPDRVTTRQVDPSAVLQTPLHDTSQVIGQPAVYAIPKDSQVTLEALGGGISDIGRQLKPGEKAIAFQVDRVTGLDFLIQVGDHVDIVLGAQLTVLQPTADTVSKPANQQRFETVPGLEKVRSVKTILQDKRVLYVSQTRLKTQAQAAPSASPGTGNQAQQAQPAIENVIIVIAGTDQDAEVIKFAQNDVSEVGPLTAVLRSTSDTDKETTSGITIDRLVSQYGLAIPNIVKQLQKAP